MKRVQLCWHLKSKIWGLSDPYQKMSQPNGVISTTEWIALHKVKSSLIYSECLSPVWECYHLIWSQSLCKGCGENGMWWVRQNFMPIGFTNVTYYRKDKTRPFLTCVFKKTNGMNIEHRLCVLSFYHSNPIWSVLSSLFYTKPNWTFTGGR